MRLINYKIITSFLLFLFLFTLPQIISGKEISSDDKNYQSLMEIGNKNLKIQRWDAAVEAFENALKINTTAEAYGGMARGKFGKVKVKHERVLPMRALSNRRALKDAETNYKKAMELEPDNLTWQYELAEVYFYKKGKDELKAAAKLLEEVYNKNEDFRDANYMLYRIYQSLNDDRQLKNHLARMPDEKIDSRVLLQRSYDAAREDSLDAAEELFNQAIENMDSASEPVVLAATDMIFTDLEKEDWKNSLNRSDFMREFWLLHDPSPKTPENERVQEHLRRIVYAQKHYNSPGSQNNYDDRGRIYIKYGEPDYRYQSPGDMAVYRNESWTYDYKFSDNNEGLVFDFVNVAGYGFRQVNDLRDAIMGTVRPATLLAMYRDRADVNYAYYGRLASMSSDLQDFYFNLQELNERKLTSYLNAPPEAYSDKDNPVKNIPVYLSQASFRGENGTTRYELYYAIPLESLKFRKVNDYWTNALSQDITVRKERNQDLWSDQRMIELEFEQGESFKEDWYINEIGFDLPPQDRSPVAHLLIRDPDDNKMTLTSCKLSKKDYSGGSLMVSDMKFSSKITPSRDEGPFNRNGLKVVPLVTNKVQKDTPLQVYFEIYNLRLAQSNQTKYELQYIIQKKGARNGVGFAQFDEEGNLMMPSVRKDMREYVSLESELTGSREQQETYLTLDLSSLNEGEYEFFINVRDVNSGKHAYSWSSIVLEK